MHVEIVWGTGPLKSITAFLIQDLLAHQCHEARQCNRSEDLILVVLVSNVRVQNAHAGVFSMQQKVVFNNFRLSAGTEDCLFVLTIIYTKLLSGALLPSNSLMVFLSCALISAPPSKCLMANWYFNAFDVSPGTGVPQQLQAIHVHPNTSSSGSSPETCHTSTNSNGRLTMGCV